MHVIEELAQFVSGHPKDAALPDATQQRVLLHLADLIAAAVAGQTSLLTIAARSGASALYGPGLSRVWFTAQSLSIAGAAVANAAAASALDIDDGHRGAAGHPGAGIIPAVFAVAEAIGSDDKQIFDAIALGYDIALRIASSRPDGSVTAYCSGLWVGYGVAAAAGRLLGLTTPQLAHALAIAGAEGPASFPTGSSENEATTVKEMIPPAVTVGLAAAYRARAGATGPLDLLDDPNRFDRKIMTADLGQVWWIEDCYLKPYACCRYMHAAIDAILILRKPGKSIRSLRIETFSEGLTLPNSRAPATLEAAQYSYPFNCALAALYGAEALQPVDPAKLGDREALELAGRIELIAHEDFACSFPATTPCRVIIDQGNGPESLTIDHPLGDLANPMSRSQVTEKFRRISAQVISEKWQDTLLAALDGVPISGFAPLFNALAAMGSET